MADFQHSTTAPSAKPGTSSPPVPLTDLSINGVTPFYSPGDGVAERLNEVHGLLLVLSNGHECAARAGDPAREEFGLLNPMITASALNGIATLVALAMHHVDAAEGVRRGNA